MPGEEREIYQPIHLNIRSKLDPEYVAFHDKYMQYVPCDESKIWDGSARIAPSLPFGGAATVKVASVQDIELPKIKLRAYIPQVNHASKLPCLLWFHGGGWAIGGLNDGKDFCSFLCREAQCVVITVDYRLAPEDPYPAAVNDAVDSLLWVSSIGKDLFGLDLDRIAVGGTSAGANLAIVLCLKAARDLEIRVCYQLLIVPVVDNTATADGIWSENCDAPWLTPTRMIWYRRMYMPVENDWKNWDASPHLAPESLLKRLPPTWIAISGQDLLAPEARLFAQQLNQLKVPVTVYDIEGGTHSILALWGVLSTGKVMIKEAAKALKGEFGRETRKGSEANEIV
ncbi:Alpha/Beta hydrolase protein [Venturia nashicola]|nr:Alpha/Beta hydrolase protein [Venturia nashicola]